MKRTRFWVGIDAGEDTLACCIINDQGEVAQENSLPANAVELKKLLKPFRRQVSLIGVEAGSTGILIARSMLRLGYPVSVFEARKASKFLGIKLNKTDKNDARGLAEIARIGRSAVSEVRVKDIESQHLRSSLVMRQKLVRVRVGAEGAIRSLIRLNGGRWKAATSATTLGRNVRAELSRLKRTERVDLREQVEPILKLCESLRSYLEDSDRTLTATAEQNPMCRRFMEIPGVGPICALSFYTAIDEPFRFRRNADVGAYLGMTPRVRQSGQSTAKLRISKMGSRMTRSHLVTAAGIHLRCGESAIRDWGLALRERAGKGRARVAVARKLAITMLAIWKSGRSYEPYPSVRL